MDQIQKYHFYINLEKREERNIHCINELNKIGITEPNRFNAISDKIGLIGCTKSHIACVEIAKEKEWPFVCIFEDDLLFLKPNKVIEKVEKYINTEYDVLFLGAWIRNGNYNFINDDLIKVSYACCTHAYIVKNHYYDTYLNNLNTSLKLKIKDPDNYLYNNDEYIRILQERDNWLCFHPILATQKNGYSDNFNEIRNYSKVITNVPKIFKETNNKDIIMEENRDIIVQENFKNIEVSLELIQNVRNIIDVANGRIQWKTEELLPVGLVIKQLDELLKKD